MCFADWRENRPFVTSESGLLDGGSNWFRPPNCFLFVCLFLSTGALVLLTRFLVWLERLRSSRRFLLFVLCWSDRASVSICGCGRQDIRINLLLDTAVNGDGLRRVPCNGYRSWLARPRRPASTAAAAAASPGCPLSHPVTRTLRTTAAAVAAAAADTPGAPRRPRGLPRRRPKTTTNPWRLSRRSARVLVVVPASPDLPSSVCLPRRCPRLCARRLPVAGVCPCLPTSFSSARSDPSAPNSPRPRRFRRFPSSPCVPRSSWSPSSSPLFYYGNTRRRFRTSFPARASIRALAT